MRLGLHAYRRPQVPHQQHNSRHEAGCYQELGLTAVVAVAPTAAAVTAAATATATTIIAIVEAVASATISTPAAPEGVLMVTSDAHSGLKHAIKAVLPGASWQRCRVHFARNITQTLGSARSKPVNALVSTIFAQTSQEAVIAQYKHVIDTLRDPFPSESPRC